MSDKRLLPYRDLYEQKRNEYMTCETSEERQAALFGMIENVQSQILLLNSDISKLEAEEDNPKLDELTEKLITQTADGNETISDALLEEYARKCTHRSAFHIVQVNNSNYQYAKFAVHRRELEEGEDMERGKLGRYLETFLTRNEALDYIHEQSKNCKEHMIFE